MANNRDDILDFAKGLLICLVVYAHLPMEGKWHDSLHSLAGFLYTFHIYAFVRITGFLFSRKLNGGRKEILKVAVRMFKPYFAVGVLNVLFYCIAGKLGIKTTNNHAFRISYNATLIDAGLSSRDRALLLGHTVQVNESRYSVSDKRRLERIKDTLQKREVI